VSFITVIVSVRDTIRGVQIQATYCNIQYMLDFIQDFFSPLTNHLYSLIFDNPET